ncbi:MAG: trimeric intracellular cation channel family protein [Oscillospiraceae bacterium]|nr:trimeric intracellular cation channel family protein [Oscillospiraceae bacterium]
MLSSWILAVLDWIGTVSFAISGSLIAIGHGLDLFGVLAVGTITAVGGGMIRDVILGNIPPSIFFRTEILFAAVLTSVLVFIIIFFRSNRFSIIQHRVDKFNFLFDSFGLGAFSVTGVQLACDAGYGEHFVLCVLMGCLTGVGGGVVRDMLVNVKPYVFTKHVYAVASLLGSILYYMILQYTPYGNIGSFAALFAVVLIRLFAAHFHWELPKIRNTDED